MERPCEEVVASYLKWTPRKNHWMEHDGSQWKHDPLWDKAYPKFAAQSKEEAILQYCIEYAQQARALQSKHPNHIMIVALRDFNESSMRESILDFIQYTGKRHTDVDFVHNSLQEVTREHFKNRVILRLVNIKRKLIGRPGHRFGRSKKHPLT
jgi:hypothetical protein